jgi:hypothetical protein
MVSLRSKRQFFVTYLQQRRGTSGLPSFRKAFLDITGACSKKGLYGDAKPPRAFPNKSEVGVGRVAARIADAKKSKKGQCALIFLAILEFPF